jgi:hypothetical protein
MTTTAWRFIATEGAYEAVLKLKQLEAAKLVEVQDVTIIRLVRPDFSARELARHPDNLAPAIAAESPALPQWRHAPRRLNAQR